MATTIATEYIKVPRTEYLLLKEIYKLNKKQQDLSRIYEVEENLKKGNYKTIKIDDFIDSI